MIRLTIREGGVHIHIRLSDDENGLFFRPDCTSYCMTKTNNGDKPCHQNHPNVVHASMNNPGQYVLFPANCFHCGYYNTNVRKIFITAQLFAVFNSRVTSCHSRKDWHNSDFYQVQTLLPRTLHALKDDLLLTGMTAIPLQSFHQPNSTRILKLISNQTEWFGGKISTACLMFRTL